MKVRLAQPIMLMLCPICAGEFHPQEPFCPGCGCGLIPASLEQTVVTTRKEAVELVELCRPRLYPVAMLIKQTLEQHGVTVLVKGGHSISVMPHLAFGGELRVLVDGDQIEYARALYEAYFESDEETDYIEEGGADERC